MKQSEYSSGLTLDKDNHERQETKLNKLEAYLLKLCIPFIRVAHCPRSSYLKVMGDLILISSDLSHSLGKILPIQQSLIPVSFKRKLSYTGSYMEQLIEKDKIKMYFSWLKKYNHLYADVKLDTTLLEEFEDNSLSASRDFERVTRGENLQFESNESDEEIDESEEIEESEEISFIKNCENFEPYIESSTITSHDQTTMFLNKYCENPELPSIANRMAESIVNFEIRRDIACTIRDDFDIDDEFISEEEYLANVDAEMDNQAIN